MPQLIFVLTIFVSISLLIILGLALRSKQKVGEILIKFESSNNNQIEIITLILFSLLIWILGLIFTDWELHFLLLFWTPILFFIINPAYLGERGIKAGYVYISRENIKGYQFIEGKRPYVELLIEKKEKPIKLTINLKGQRDDMQKSLDSYFQQG